MSTKEQRKMEKINAKKAAKKAERAAIAKAAEGIVEEVVREEAIFEVEVSGNTGAELVTTKQTYSDKIIAVPEKVKTEINDEAFVSVPRKVIEKEKIIKVKEIVEIPEIEYIDEIITEEYVQDVHREIVKPITIEREVEQIVHVEEIETVEVQVPDVTYDDVVVVKDVPVPHIVEKEVIIERVVPQIREEIIEDVNYIYQDREVQRNIPVPVEATVTQHFVAPRIEAVHKEKDYKVLLPEFREHAVWDVALTDEGRALLPDFQARVDNLAGSSLCEVEKLFCDFKATDLIREDWLDTKAFKGRDGIQYLGVENLVINKPQFKTVSRGSNSVRSSVASKIDQDGKSKKKIGFCGLGGDTTSQTGRNIAPEEDRIPKEQFAMVENVNQSRTMIATGVSYARRGQGPSTPRDAPSIRTSSDRPSTARDTRSSQMTATRESAKKELRPSRSLSTAVSH